MAKHNYCGDCDIEFKVRHDADDDYFIVMYCPFCGVELAIAEQNEFQTDEEDEDK